MNLPPFAELDAIIEEEAEDERNGSVRRVLEDPPPGATTAGASWMSQNGWGQPYAPLDVAPGYLNEMTRTTTPGSRDSQVSRS